MEKHKITSRPIDVDDLELLRFFKNHYKHAFFYKDEISYKAQIIWFQNFSKRKDAQIFLILEGPVKRGCIGLYRHEGFIELRNVISFSEKKDALASQRTPLYYGIIDALKKFQPISSDVKLSVDVLKTNEHIIWYEKNGFKKIEQFDNFWRMEKMEVLHD